MKRIFTAMVEPLFNDGEFEMKEINVCEYGEQWNGDIDGYLDNLDADISYTDSEDAFANIRQNYGPYDPIKGSIRVVICEGFPCEIYWVSECEAEKPFTAESFGADIPTNWEEIAEYLNTIYDETHEDPNEIWERYWQDEYPDAPKPIE